MSRVRRILRWFLLPVEVTMLASFVFVLRAALEHGPLYFWSVLVGGFGFLVFSMLSDRLATWYVKRLLRKAARPRTLIKGTPTDPGDPPDDPDTMIVVLMTRGAAYKLRSALIHADQKLNPDFHHPADDPNAFHSEWLMWAVGRIEVAEEVSKGEGLGEAGW